MASITLDSVSVDFPIFNVQGRSFKKKLFQLTTGGTFSQDFRNCVVVKALDQVSLTLKDGDRLGLVGHNGAGKSTLLRVLANIYEPSRGTYTYQGKVSPLLDVMLGMNQESTGYENIFLRGTLLGLTQQEIKARVEDIADFTELGDYLYMPMRTYSSGMLMRLAFAVATSIQPDILLLDEAIGVGDKRFIKKANARLRQFIRKSNILILASHSEDIIRSFCNKALILNKGKIEKFGRVQEVLGV